MVQRKRLINERQTLGVLIVALLLLGGLPAPAGTATPSVSAEAPLTTQITGGGSHSCALLDNGTAKCWGHNFPGKLGDGTTSPRAIPVPVVGLDHAIGIEAGLIHTCAVRTSGDVWCWGDNKNGQLGDGTTTHRPVPVPVVGLDDVISVTAGLWHTCALLASGTAKCWGVNGHGQLGDGSTTNRQEPVTVAGIGDAVAIAAGHHHTCALLADGQARCWGRNDWGQLGDNTTAERLTPVAVMNITGVKSIAAGSRHTCAVYDDDPLVGATKCWGHNGFGQLGTGKIGHPLIPEAIETHGVATQITAGPLFSCALLEGVRDKCWGDNSYGQLGDGTTTHRGSPKEVKGVLDALSISAGWEHTCAVHADGTGKCWGRNTNGQLGDGTGTDRLEPVWAFLSRSLDPVIATVPEAECEDRRQTVALDGSASSNPAGNPIKFSWSAFGITFGNPRSATPSASFPLGDTTVTLLVTSTHGAWNSLSTTVSVVDTLPPTIEMARPTNGSAYLYDIEVAHGQATETYAVGPLTVIAAVQDRCGVAHVDFVSSTGATGRATTAPYSIVSDPTITASGPVTVTATVTDHGGQPIDATVGFVQAGTAVIDG